MVAVLHDGVDWWPNLEPGGPPTLARADRLGEIAGPWAAAVDLVVGGHVPDGWVGELAGTPAGMPTCSRTRCWWSTCRT